MLYAVLVSILEAAAGRRLWTPSLGLGLLSWYNACELTAGRAGE